MGLGGYGGMRNEAFGVGFNVAILSLSFFVQIRHIVGNRDSLRIPDKRVGF